MRVGNEVQARTAAATAAITALVEALVADQLAAAAPVPPTQAGNDSTELATALERVRAVGQARTTVRELVTATAAEAAEAALDVELLAARRVQPRGASWRELGEVLQISHQALSKRARRRGLDRARTLLDGRPGPRRRFRVVPQPSTETLRWRSAVTEHRERLAADAATRTPSAAARSATPRDVGTGAAFWRAQQQP